MEIENWLRGKVDGVPDLLQPAAHAFLQTKEEAREYLKAFPEEKLWVQPYGRASVGFHLQHIAGVTNRLFTYARGEQLSEAQIDFFKKEGVENFEISLADLLKDIELQIDQAIDYLRTLEEADLTRKVEIGRKRLPSNLIGVTFHAAEHSQRHIGQLLVTASVVKGMD